MNATSTQKGVSVFMTFEQARKLFESIGDVPNSIVGTELREFYRRLGEELGFLQRQR